MGGNRGFSRVHSLHKTGVLFNAGLFSTCSHGTERRRRHDIIARGSRGFERREYSHDEGNVRIAIREAGAALHNPPEYDGPVMTRAR